MGAETVRVSFVALLAALVAGSASARQIKPPPSVLGVQLGGPITLPECPRMSPSGPYDTFGIEVACWLRQTAPGLEGIEVWTTNSGTPSYLRPPIQVRVVNGNVERIEVRTLGIDHEAEALDSLKKKFGAPTSLSYRRMQNGYGATFKAAVATWIRPNYKVQFNSVLTAMDRGILIVETPKGNASQAAADKAEPEL